jgi:metal-responsive CopG/Arc/MetJ family transcriptional regulator
MKTAISIPDAVYKEAERASKRMGISRSRLYTMAIERLLEAQRSRGITESLNEIYKKEDSRLDPVWMAMQMTSLPPEDEGW